MHIKLENLRKRYSGGWALDGLNLEIEPGQIISLLGPNGAGKTTLLRCLAGMTVPDEGRILFDNEPFARDSVEQRMRFHFMPDFPTLFPEQPVIRNLSTMLRMYEQDTPGMEEHVIALLQEFDLLPLIRRRMNRLSRGQEYKAALVGLIAADPDVWLMDEPFASGMDPHGISTFKRHALEAANRGRTIIYSTQILEIAERFSDRACVIHDGELVACAPLEKLSANSATESRVLERVFAQLKDSSTDPAPSSNERS